jgi:transposase-like protein
MELAQDVSKCMQIPERCRRTVVTSVHSWCMRRGDVICPQCNAGFRRIELASRSGKAGEFRCPLCDQVLEVFDGSTEIAYRITVAPEKLFE